jgi:Protein of unknown function (DUF3309)
VINAEGFNSFIFARRRGDKESCARSGSLSRSSSAAATATLRARRGNDLAGTYVEGPAFTRQQVDAMLRTLLFILLIILLIGALPAWPYSTGWGYYPSGGAGLLLVVLIVLIVAGAL